MVHTRSLFIAAASAAVALFAAAAVVSNGDGDNASSAKSSTGRPTLWSIPPASQLPHAWQTQPQTPSPPAGNRRSQSGPSATTPIQAVPHSNDADSFILVVRTRAGDIPANVAPISVRSNQPVDPPHSTAQEWNTAVWVRQSAYPSAPSEGTSYVYGHACHYHVCPFTNLKQARVGDDIVVTTPWGVLTYRIGQIGLSPKSAAALPSWASDSTVANRLVLVTCEFEQGDTSTNNIVVVARLVAARSR